MGVNKMSLQETEPGPARAKGLKVTSCCKVGLSVKGVPAPAGGCAGIQSGGAGRFSLYIPEPTTPHKRVWANA